VCVEVMLSIVGWRSLFNEPVRWRRVLTIQLILLLLMPPMFMTVGIVSLLQKSTVRSVCNTIQYSFITIEIWSQRTRDSPLSYGKTRSLYLTHLGLKWYQVVTDRQTDRQTYGRKQQVRLQSQTDRCEGDVYKYNSITNRQLARRTVLWDSTATSDYR